MSRRRPARTAEFACVPTPPDDFDPLTAPGYPLRWHGFPRRPDPEREPQLNRLWQQMFARPIRFAEAELEVATNLAERRRRRGPAFEDNIWAGAMRAASTTRTFPRRRCSSPPSGECLTCCQSTRMDSTGSPLGSGWDSTAPTPRNSCRAVSLPTCIRVVSSEPMSSGTRGANGSPTSSWTRLCGRRISDLGR